MNCLPDAQSRAGHGMVINDQMAKLYILGGTRSKVEMNDFIEIDYITEVSQKRLIAIKKSLECKNATQWFRIKCTPTWDYAKVEF